MDSFNVYSYRSNYFPVHWKLTKMPQNAQNAIFAVFPQMAYLLSFETGNIRQSCAWDEKLFVEQLYAENLQVSQCQMKQGNPCAHGWSK